MSYSVRAGSLGAMILWGSLSILVFGAPSQSWSASASSAKKQKSKTEREQASFSDKNIKITCDNSEIAPNSQRAMCKGHVLVLRDGMRVDCDLLTVDYDDQKRAKKLECKGNAHMLQAAVNGRPEREAWGELAVFDNQTAMLTVTGSPRAREGNNSLRGEKVVFMTRDDRLLVEKPSLVLEISEKGATEKGSPAKSSASVISKSQSGEQKK